MMIVGLLVIGFVIGVFVISMGGGGAAFYLGVLTAVFGLDPHTAAATSLVTALPSLALGAFTYYRQGKVNVKLGNQMLLAALPAVIVGSLVAPYIPQTIYKWVIGLILAGLGVNILFQKNGGAPKQRRWLASLFGVLSGLMVGIAGLSGGGPIIAGLLMMGLDMMDAAATSSYVLVFMSLVGALLHLTGGAVDWHAGLGLMIGALGGALVAPHLMTHLTSGKFANYLKPFMALLLIVMGIKTII
ncbi:sulfite exporter TauE/SafE family protein [Lacticaseibacillus yichunensis]|uniref:Probable membrane transporter protein n=1 Tax=Lacticaseibacillus yichunensis TaxID=2486015 RepID=A0ABW4CNZ7_9LACO|nr:sulfite exporter TauE/SafE family protein [Lacticaseibacillus yichunensis]